MNDMTPTEALAAWEAADARKAAAAAEVAEADAAWVTAAEHLANSIEAAIPDGNGRQTVMIGGKVVRVEWDDYWTVVVQTPPVLT